MTVEHERCYPGTNVPVTAGLFTLECENGHKDWYMLPRRECFRCGAKIIKGIPTYYKEHSYEQK